MRGNIFSPEYMVSNAIALLLAAACIILLVKNWKAEGMVHSESMPAGKDHVSDKQRFDEKAFPHY